MFFRVCHHVGTTTMCIKCVIRALYNGFMGYIRPGTLRIWSVLEVSCGPVLTTQLGSSCKMPALCSVLTTICWTPSFVKVWASMHKLLYKLYNICICCCVCVFAAVCVCSLLCVCTWMGKCRARIHERVTILGCMSRHFHYNVYNIM